MQSDWASGVQNRERVSAVRRCGLLDTEPEDAFDRLTEVAAAVIGVERSFITVVDADRYWFKSAVGLAEGAAREGRIEESFCRYVVGSGLPLVVTDASADERTWDNPAIKSHRVAAWAGYPVEDPDGTVLGTFCVADDVPHEWTHKDLHLLATLAQSASLEVAVRYLRRELAVARRELASRSWPPERPR
jgi:sigma-B regulation protein RsbU (phosphoserine phosphatase)